MATTMPPLRQNTGSSGTSNSHYRQSSIASSPSKQSDTVSTQNDSTFGAQQVVSQPTSPDSPINEQQNGHQYPAPVPRLPSRMAPRPVRSQYPSDSTEKHVEYILVASFDIDRGSVIEHQYPGPVGGDEHMLAELMLPDQAHMRQQDWTIFFLHKDAAAEEEEQSIRRRKRRRLRRKTRLRAAGAGEDEDDEVDGDSDEVDEDDDGSDLENGLPEEEDTDQADGPPLVYVLNLVNTKHDTTTRRGAICKAMAVCTRHSFLHIYKPLLLLALEQYFANPVVETLADLYNAVNSMDLSLLPRLTMWEKFLLHGVEVKDLFIEKFEAMIAHRMAAGTNDSSTSDLTTSPTVAQPGARTRYGLPRDTHEFDSVVRYTNIPVPIKVPTAINPETVGDFSLIKLITTFSTPHTTAPQPFSPLHPHLTTGGSLTHPIIVLMNALLTQKRVIFLGHNLPSSDVAEAVLAACALASGGFLRGFTRHAFPYTDLTKIDDLLKVPGFIAGVTNPAFAHHAEWWDLLCDMSTGRMKISPKVEAAAAAEGVSFFQKDLVTTNHSSGSGGFASFAGVAGASIGGGLGANHTSAAAHSGDGTGDIAFMGSVLTAINQRRGEHAIRQKFRLWILKFTRLAAAFEESVYGASALHVQAQSGTPRSPFTGAELSQTDLLAGLDGGGGTPKTPLPGQIPTEVQGHGYVWPSRQLRTLELASNATRIEGWRNTRTYYNFIQDLAAEYATRPIKSVDLQHVHDKLAKLRLPPSQAADIYLTICSTVRTDQEICQLLSVVVNGSWDSKGGFSPGTGQGLFYIALGLFHPRLDVREAVGELLLRIQEHEAGRHFWASLGRFAKIAWERVMAAREARMERETEE